MATSVLRSLDLEPKYAEGDIGSYRTYVTECSEHKRATMVDAIAAVMASAETFPTKVESSLSITSEPDNKWVAERQSQIDADQDSLRQERQASARSGEPSPLAAEEELPPLFEGHERKRRIRSEGVETPGGATEELHLLSGESEEIGSVNFDESTPFGHRTAIV